MQAIRETDLILNPDGSVYHLGLVPANVSDTIIAVGDPDRVEKITKHFDKVEFRVRKREFVTHTGTVGKKRISVISTGIGTDNVEICLQELDALFNIDLTTRQPKQEKKRLTIIRVGTSGALRKDVPLDSHLVSEYAAGFDNLMSFYDLPMDDTESLFARELKSLTGLQFLPYVVRGTDHLVARFEKSMIKGNTVTCPGFYAPQGRSMRISARYPDLLDNLGKMSGGFMPSNLEMETSGYFSLGRLLGHNVASVNAILANRATGEFSRQPGKSVDALIRKVLEQF